MFAFVLFHTEFFEDAEEKGETSSLSGDISLFSLGSVFKKKQKKLTSDLNSIFSSQKRVLSI